MQKIIVLALVFVASQAVEYGHGEGHSVDYYTEPHYSFAYEVKDTHTGDIKSQKEERKGDLTQGVYSLIEPDGSKRIVEYVVKGKSGFNAQVHRDHSSHPQSYKSGGFQSGGYQQSLGGYGGDLISTSSYQSLGGQSESGYGSHGYSSLGRHDGGYSGNLGGGYTGNHGSGYSENLGGYRSSLSGHGDATSSVQFATHGAKIYTTTKHIIPQKHY